MSDTGSTAAALIPAQPTPERLRAAAAGCRACELWREGTQTVFGEGPSRARIVAVGEQPGDREDRDGRPFVGPAGRLFDTALERAGIDRAEVYVTNAVKHFHHDVRGKRRIHRKPELEHIRACEPWLEAELAVIHPALAIAMGATAARALLGRPIKVTEARGTILDTATGPPVLVTVHPSSILRARDDREPQLEAFVRDLAAAAAIRSPGSTVRARRRGASDVWRTSGSGIRAPGMERTMRCRIQRVLRTLGAASRAAA